VKNEQELKKYVMRREFFDTARKRLDKQMDITKLLYRFQKVQIMKQILLKSHQASLIKLFRNNTVNYDTQWPKARDNWEVILKRLRDYKDLIENSLVKDADPSDIKIVQGLMSASEFAGFKGSRAVEDWNHKFFLSNFMRKKKEEEERERIAGMSQYVTDMLKTIPNRLVLVKSNKRDLKAGEHKQQSPVRKSKTVKQGRAGEGEDREDFDDLLNQKHDGKGRKTMLIDKRHTTQLGEVDEGKEDQHKFKLKPKKVEVSQEEEEEEEEEESEEESEEEEQKPRRRR